MKRAVLYCSLLMGVACLSQEADEIRVNFEREQPHDLRVGISFALLRRYVRT